MQIDLGRLKAAQELIQPGHASPALNPRIKLGYKLLDDPRVFLDLCLRARLGVPATGLQKDMMLWIVGGPPKRILMAYRGATKSWMSAIAADWWIFRDFVLREGHPEINILVLSGDQNRADGFSLFCREIIQLVPDLRMMVPTDPIRWSGKAFDVTGAPISQTPTLASRSIMGRITGDRADIVIPDDVEIPSNSETQGQRDKLLSRFGEMQNVIKPGGHCLTLGTPHTEDSTYNRLSEWGFSRRIYPARYPKVDKLPDYQGDLAPWVETPIRANAELERQPIIDCMFDEAGLLNKAANGRSAFEMQFMLDTRLGDEDRYPLKLRDLIVADCSPERAPERPVWSGSPERIRGDLINVGLTGDRWQGPAEISGDRWGPTDGCVLAVDPSGRGKDETAWSVVAAQGAWIYLLENRGDIRGYETDVLDAICDSCENFGVQRVIYEDNFGDGMFGTLLGRRLRERGLHVGIDGKHHSTQKESRILDILEPVFNSHKLVVSPSVIENDRAVAGGDASIRYRLWYQATRMQRVKGALEHDDRVESLSMAVAFWKERLAIDQEEFVRDRELLEMDDVLNEFWSHVPGFRGGQQHTSASNSGLRCHDA